MQYESGACHRYDVIVVGGGHNGLVAAAYLGRAGLKVAVLEARDSFGGPCGTFEFMPGYRTSMTNSPGSFQSRFVHELDLESFGLCFARPDPTVVHFFGDDCFVGFRDPARVAAQFDRYAAGEAARQSGFLSKLEELGRQLFHCGLSIYAPSPNLVELARRLPQEQQRLFDRVFFGSLQQLLDEELESDEVKAILGMVALNTVLAPPSAPGTAVGLMLRPISLASVPVADASDPRLMAFRGSTGLPIGGMGAIIDALTACCRHHGVDLYSNVPIAKVLHRNGHVTGVASASGDEFYAERVVSTINPKILFGRLLDDEAVGHEIRRDIEKLPMRGSAFKLVLALDSLPGYAGLPADVSAEAVSACQFRYGASLEHIEHAVADGLRGMCSREPILWGLISSVTSPGVAPEGRHLISVNAWHAPYELSEGHWDTEKDLFGQRCIDVLARMMPDIKDRIVGHRFMSPVDIESEFGMVESNITHGDMLASALFGNRPHFAANDYRTPLNGLYLSGSGTWPGGYVTGIPGFNASNVVIEDIKSAMDSAFYTP